MMKLFGGIKSLTENNNDIIQLTDENDTYFSRGAIQRGGNNSRGFSYRSRNNFGNRYSPPQNRISGTASGGGTNPKILASKLNPQKFGKIMECHQCGARTHLMSACPELNS